GGAGLLSKHRKAHNNIPVTYATNFGIVAGCYCDEVSVIFRFSGARELATRKSAPTTVGVKKPLHYRPGTIALRSDYFHFRDLIGSVDMEEPHVDPTTLPLLHPGRQNGAKWFNHHTQVSTAVRKIIQSCFKGPWYSWKRVPVFYKQTWFSLFKKKFNWHPTINNQAAGSSKQGYVFGLGALKEFVVPSANASSSQPQPEEAEMIANRLQELEAEVKQNHEENLEIKKRLEAMEKMAESFANQNA
ncbi:unnamed protein product, partial [Thlaspi arvense]